MCLSILLPIFLPFSKFSAMGMEWCLMEIKLSIFKCSN